MWARVQVGAGLIVPAWYVVGTTCELYGTQIKLGILFWLHVSFCKPSPYLIYKTRPSDWFSLLQCATTVSRPRSRMIISTTFVEMHKAPKSLPSPSFISMISFRRVLHTISVSVPQPSCIIPTEVFSKYSSYVVCRALQEHHFRLWWAGMGQRGYVVDELHVTEKLTRNSVLTVHTKAQKLKHTDLLNEIDIVENPAPNEPARKSHRFSNQNSSRPWRPKLTYLLGLISRQLPEWPLGNLSSICFGTHVKAQTKKWKANAISS